ncbi:hypothetical protein AB0B45_30180 [Nonomuraea sp. NPDC049152]|uniref:hypothetical protein n=1 Tax=Nonomuraea sp. NPDC049152 TaxID=3154350 RepID=UPI0033E16468
MTLGKSLIAVLLAGAAGITPPSGPPDEPRQVSTEQPGGAGAANSVTLITGDRVIVTGRLHRVEPGPGRDVRSSRT